MLSTEARATQQWLYHLGDSVSPPPAAFPCPWLPSKGWGPLSLPPPYDWMLLRPSVVRATAAVLVYLDVDLRLSSEKTMILLVVGTLSAF